jgi:hypothetical protein
MNANSPASARRRGVASSASSVQRSAPIPPATSEASVKVGIVARQAKTSADPVAR